MALPILDGNQSATTLSTILAGGAHIPAHTVISFGTQAISDITSAVSGVSVSISGTQTTTFSAVTGSVSVLNFPSTQTIAGTVTVGNSLTIQSGTISIEEAFGESAFMPISGTVTANAVLDFTNGGDNIASDDGGVEPGLGVQLGYWDSAIGEYRLVRPSAGLPVSGTVTANTGINLGSNQPVGVSTGVVPAIILDDEGYSVNDIGRGLNTFVKNSVTIGSLPAISGTISGTVTVGAMPNGSLVTRFGSVANANLAFITSAVTNTSRKYLLAQNISAGTVTIGIGFSPTTTQGIQLTAGAGLTFDSFCPTGAVFWLGAVTGAAFTILEG